MVHNVNEKHRDSLSGSEELALKITKSVGTLLCVYIFAIIGGFSLVAVLTNNTFFTLLFGAVSSYFLQLVLLPLILLGQNVQSRHDSMRAEEDYTINKKAEAEIELIQEKLTYLLRQSNKERRKNGKRITRLRVR